MSRNVVDLDTITRLDLPPERILRSALEADLESVLIIGLKKGDDVDLYFAGSMASGPENLWLLALAKKRLLAIGDPGEAA